MTILISGFKQISAGLLMVVFLTHPARAEVALLGVGSIPGDRPDRSGLKGKLSDGTPRNRLGGMGSGIAYTGKNDRYLLVSDKGPKGGAADFACRFHEMKIVVTPGDKRPVELQLVATILLTDEAGNRFVGALKASDGKITAASRRLDLEGVRVGPHGTVFLSDEYGPFLCEFDPRGKRLRSLKVPERFLAANPGLTSADELPPHNTKGRQPNRGMEGLAISPNGGQLFGIMQGPLLQDGALDKNNKRIGVNIRLLELTLATAKTREFVYRLDDPGTAVSEILAVNDRKFLVLERDGKGGTDAKFKKLFLIDTEGATDVSETNSLPSGALPSKIIPVKKQLFLDFLAPRFKLAGKTFPAKIEGLAFGPDLPDGRRLLLVTADNDFIATVPFRVYAFAIDRADLPDYQPQQFNRRK